MSSPHPPHIHLQLPLHPFLCTSPFSSTLPSPSLRALLPTPLHRHHLSNPQPKRTIHLRFLLDRSSWRDLFPASTCPHCHNHLSTTTPRRFGNFLTRNRGGRLGAYQDLPVDVQDDETSIRGSGEQPQQQQHQETGRVFLEDKEQPSKEDQRKRSSTSSYSSAGEGMPRPSTDDETARLV